MWLDVYSIHTVFWGFVVHCFGLASTMIEILEDNNYQLKYSIGRP
jgi:hypothetical protein